MCAVEVSPWLLVFVAFGLLIAPAYNLEWFGGRFHSDVWFAVSWGAFPLLTAYFVTAERLSIAAALGAAMAFTGSMDRTRGLSELISGSKKGQKREKATSQGSSIWRAGQGLGDPKSGVPPGDNRPRKAVALHPRGRTDSFPDPRDGAGVADWPSYPRCCAISAARN